eukprot:6495627-Pyramimonas_sp.AAC.1
MPWAGRRAEWLLARLAATQAAGKTAYDVNRGNPHRGQVAALGEVAWARAPGDRAQKAEAQWRLGVWLREERRALGRRVAADQPPSRCQEAAEGTKVQRGRAEQLRGLALGPS